MYGPLSGGGVCWWFPWRRWIAALVGEIISMALMGVRKIIVVSVVAFLGISALAMVAVAVLLGQVFERERASSEAEARETYADPRALISSESNLDFDPRDERALIENSEEVFVGEVERLVARGDNDPMPFLEGWTATARFAVRVEEVRKDDSPGDGLEAGQTVTINQLSVPPPDTCATVCFGNGFPGGYVPAQKLEEGTRYVFATEYHSREGWHDVRVDPFEWMVLSEDAPPDEAPEAGDGEPPCNPGGL